jgi:hypothetical protein
LLRAHFDAAPLTRGAIPTVGGLPIGLQAMGSFLEDRTTLALVRLLEMAQMLKAPRAWEYRTSFGVAIVDGSRGKVSGAGRIMITLYDSPLSPFCRKVRMVLEHKQLEFVTVDESTAEDWGRFNRRAEIPILLHDDLAQLIRHRRLSR